jgi:hypothetical protein
MIALRRLRVQSLWMCALCLAALPVLGQHIQDDPARLRLESASAVKEGKAAHLEIPPKVNACDHYGAISCGQTVSGTLTRKDCELSDGSFADFWEFEGVHGQPISVTMISKQLDTYLILFDPISEAVEHSDNGGGGTNARIASTLSSTGSWAIGANAAPDETGSYTLTLNCSASSSGAPAAPSNLRATAISSTEVDLDWDDNSSNETSFRVEARADNEAFQERGSVSANTKGTTITNLEPGTTYTFRVRARNANGDSLYSNQATATPGEDSEDDGFITTSTIPDFQFRVRIIQGSLTINGLRETTGCVPETLCVSGALPGRPEVFLRVVGPRSNGYLWPTIVRFTPSRVEVEIQQISTRILKTYVLPAVPPESNDLSGWLDREGFRP